MSSPALQSPPKRPAAVKSSPTPKAGGTIPTRYEPRFWESADRRHAIVRSIQQRVEQLQTDTAADSMQKRTLCERAVFLISLLETAEVQSVLGEKSLEQGSYVQSLNALVGLLRALGLEKKAKKVGSLKDYVNSHSGTDQSEDES